VGWVRADGYAWRRFAYVGRERTELTIGLERSAHLRVLVANVPPELRNHVVRLHHVERGAVGELVAQRPLAGASTLEFDGLPAGTVRALLVRNPGRERPGLWLAETEVTLIAGESAVGVLDAGALQRESGTLALRVRGRTPLVRVADQSLLVYSGARPADPLHVALEPGIGADGLPESVWISPPLNPGPYQVVAIPAGLARTVEVSPGARTQGEIVLGEPAILRIELVDKVGGQPLESAMVIYRPSSCSSVTAWHETRFDPGTRRYVLGAQPSSRLTLAVQQVGYATTLEELELAPGTHERRLVLEPLSPLPIHVRIVQGGGPAPQALGYWERVRVTPLEDPRGRKTGMRLLGQQIGGHEALDAAAAHIYVDRPGSYQIEFPPLRGYREIAPIALRVAPASSAEATVELELP
jgi:hypothetical protein